MFKLMSLCVLVGAAVSAQADTARRITLIHVHDSHGQLVPHWQPFERPGSAAHWHPDSGGWAKRYTVVERIRAAQPHSLLIMNGDNFFGSAELLYTRGEALVPIVNAFAPDAYIPGNWDFANGPEAFRRLFSGADRLVRAPVLDIHLRDEALRDDAGRPKAGARVLEPYVMKDVGGVKVAILGLVTDKVAEQAEVRSRGFEFGFLEELPKFIDEVRARGAELVVLATEAQLAQAAAIARDIPGLDVVMGSDTHETLYRPIVVGQTGTRVIESGEDSYVGELDLQIADGKVRSHRWTLHHVDETVPEDPAIAALVHEARAPFLAGAAFRPHTRSLPGWDKGEGQTLSMPLDRVIAHSDTDLQRHHVLERVVDNFIRDFPLES